MPDKKSDIRSSQSGSGLMLGEYGDAPKKVNGNGIKDLLSNEAYKTLMEGTSDSTEARKKFTDAIVNVLYNAETDFKGPKTNSVNDAISRVIF